MVRTVICAYVRTRVRKNWVAHRRDEFSQSHAGSLLTLLTGADGVTWQGDHTSLGWSISPHAWMALVSRSRGNVWMYVGKSLTLAWKLDRTLYDVHTNSICRVGRKWIWHNIPHKFQTRRQNWSYNSKVIIDKPVILAGIERVIITLCKKTEQRQSSSVE